MNKTCLIAGLPSAGKTTYIAALWATEKEGNTNHELTCVKYPADTSYLDSLRKKWQNMEKVDRTALASPAEIELTMRLRGSSEEHTLLIPDFKGEVLQQVLTNVITEDVTRWCNQSNRILYFMRDLKIMTLQDEVPSEGHDIGVDEKQGIEMKLDDIPVVIQNIMLLKFLHERMGNCRIAVCISAWDAIDSIADKESVEAWVRRNHPFLYQYINTHFDGPSFYGVSAQGLDYEHTEIPEEELVQRSIEGRRAFVYHGGASDYDITLPLAELLRAE